MTVLLCSDINLKNLQSLLDRYGLDIKTIDDNEAIPGSFWQPPEAGLIGDTLYIRNDTPVHSALHEACHYICMEQTRRDNLDTDAGGTAIEENGVCYLQILLSDSIPEMKRKRMLDDMDAWGYSFRLGSAKAWFEKDAEDAFEWLLDNKVINSGSTPTWKVCI
ncbi:MAG: hypothetical protein KAJ32_06395 [Gammaproteobacteria bacterium]|nr:hypothetical protein [Gammaproteobacteria bacterium]